jgi:hypothetical protein
MSLIAAFRSRKVPVFGEKFAKMRKKLFFLEKNFAIQK